MAKRRPHHSKKDQPSQEQLIAEHRRRCRNPEWWSWYYDTELDQMQTHGLQAMPEEPPPGASEAKRRLIDHKRRECLPKACMAGNQRSCRELQNLNTTQQYRKDNPFRNEHHQRAS